MTLRSGLFLEGQNALNMVNSYNSILATENHGHSTIDEAEFEVAL